MNAAELENVCKMSECLHKLMCLWENISAKGWNFMHFRGQSHLTLYCLNLTEAHIKQCFHCYSWPRMFPSFQKRTHQFSTDLHNPDEIKRTLFTSSVQSQSWSPKDHMEFNRYISPKKWKVPCWKWTRCFSISVYRLKLLLASWCENQNQGSNKRYLAPQ